MKIHKSANQFTEQRWYPSNTLTSVKQEIAITRAELAHWSEMAAEHPDWKSPHVHVRGLRAHLRWLHQQPPEKRFMFQSFRYRYWKGAKNPAIK